MLTHVLDTSAWIVHIQQEPGWELISSLLRSEVEQVGISVLSLVELHGRLRAFGREQEFEQIVEDYRDLLARIAPVDEAVARRAVSLREATAKRLPAMDSLIAATAAQHNATLVHHDGYFAALPGELVRQQAVGAS